MYQRLIREHLAALGVLGLYQPHHVEAWMRSEHDALDGLSAAAFRRAVAVAAAAIDQAGAAASEALAASYGLTPEHHLATPA